MGRSSSSEEQSGCARSSTSRALSSPNFFFPIPKTDPPNEALGGGGQGILHPWEDVLRNPANAANPNKNDTSGHGGGGDASLREWLDREDRSLDLFECLHIFRQIVEMVYAAHEQGIVVQNIRPSCFVMSTFHQVSFIESASCSSGSDSCGDGVSDGNGGYLHSPVNDKDLPGAFVKASDASHLLSSEGQTGRTSTVEQGSEEGRKSFPLKHILVMEFNWYTTPEEMKGNPSSFASDVYRLGVLFFELVCTFSSLEEKLRTMNNLRHRVLPPYMLLKCPKESSYCLWLLHPSPESRPKISEVLKSNLLNEPDNNLREHDKAIKLSEEIKEQEILLEFLKLLQKKKKESYDRLHNIISCVSTDIEEVFRKKSVLKNKANNLTDLDKDEKSSVERADPERIDDRESSGLRKRCRPVPDNQIAEESNDHFDEKSRTDENAKRIEKIMSKSSRLMKNFKKLEDAYFLTRYRMNKPTKVQGTGKPASSLGQGSVLKTEGSFVDNLVSKSVDQKREWMHPFLDGLCKYLSFSELKVRADLKHGDLLNSSNLVCSMGFDREKKLFATAGVNRKIKVFECDTIINEDCDIHYPVVEMGGRAKISSICWNSYMKSQIASSDFEGVVQVWDVSRGQVFAEMTEHEKRVWSVDFSLADPTKLASGSDDGTVKLWNINQVGSIGTIKTKANVCSVQFSPNTSRTLAVGSADHKIYCYDLRTLRMPWRTLVGHSKTVSYVRFMDSSTLVTASTDNSIKLWDLSASTSRVIDEPVQTFRGHTNTKNFVGLSISDGYIATGSETNEACEFRTSVFNNYSLQEYGYYIKDKVSDLEVFVYHKAFPMPVLSYKFSNADPISGALLDDSTQFISSVCWRGQTSTLVAANSSGNIKLLEMV